jgi:hypothetical protein
MYVPTKMWQKKEKILKNNLSDGIYFFGEKKYVSDVLEIASLKNISPWIIADKYPTLSYTECVCFQQPKNDNIDGICSCWNSVHEGLNYNLVSENNKDIEGWD